MKRILLALLFLMLAVPAQAQNEIVVAVKNDLIARNVNLSGPCGAFEITKRVAWILRTQGWGLLDKPSGNNCQGYSTDYLVRADFAGFDILGDAGGENIPSFGSEPNEPPGAFAGRWRAPFDPGDAPAPTPPPTPTPTPTPGLEQQILALLMAHEDAQRIERERAEAFRQRVRVEWGKISKWVAVIGGSFLLGRLLVPQEDPAKTATSVLTGISQ